MVAGAGQLLSSSAATMRVSPTVIHTDSCCFGVSGCPVALGRSKVWSQRDLQEV